MLMVTEYINYNLLPLVLNQSERGFPHHAYKMAGGGGTKSKNFNSGEVAYLFYFFLT